MEIGEGEFGSRAEPKIAILQSCLDVLLVDRESCKFVSDLFERSVDFFSFKLLGKFREILKELPHFDFHEFDLI